MQALDVVKRKLHLPGHFQDTVPGYQVDLFNMETREREEATGKRVQNSSHRESS